MKPIQPNQPDPSASWFLTQGTVPFGPVQAPGAAAGAAAPNQSAFSHVASGYPLQMAQAQNLVASVLSQALGQGVTQSPGQFGQMSQAVTRQIMNNPEYRAKLEKYIGILEKFNQNG